VKKWKKRKKVAAAKKKRKNGKRKNGLRKNDKTFEQKLRVMLTCKVGKEITKPKLTRLTIIGVLKTDRK
jgi:hypothetical protein